MEVAEDYIPIDSTATFIPPPSTILPKIDIQENTGQHRNDFTSENFKIEIRGLGPPPSTILPTIDIQENTGQHRNDFTSENFKIEIRGLGRYGYGELKKLLRGPLQLNPSKVKSFTNLAYVCFRSEEERQIGIMKIDGYSWKKKILAAKIAKATQDPMVRKRLELSSIINNSNGDTAANVKRKTALEATCPLAHLPYPEQCDLKEKNAKNLLKTFGNELIKENRNLQALILENKKEFDGLPCKWMGFKESPLINGYRNKCEFSIGRNAVGDKLVGFRLGSYADGSVEVDGDLQQLPHIPDKVKRTAKLFEMYVQKSTEFDVFNTELYTGQFRQLSVRYSLVNDELMIIVGLHTSEIQDKLADFKLDLIKYFTELEGKELNVTSLYVEHINKREIGQTFNKIEHIYGALYISDSIMDRTFRISPVSFFQTNTSAAEILYRAIIELGAPDENTTVLDVCCGTGTIGICFSKHCKQVLGVDIVDEAINDAEYNCQMNNITNCKFTTGNCSDFIKTLVHQADDTKNILAVFDPPRAGLPIPATNSIRNTRELNRFVFIACSPKASKKNWLDLARRRSKTLIGNPFVPVSAVAVDMFPHTNHYELAILFERLPQQE